MKKNFIDYYAVIVLVLFIFYNYVFYALKIGGLLYQIIMYVLIIVNGIILIRFSERIKYKAVVIIVYSLIWLFSKSALQCYFDFSNIIILCAIGFFESHFVKAISILFSSLIFLYFYPLLFIFLLNFGYGLDDIGKMNDVYPDMHYYCDNHYEVYGYSAGAMDSFHYSRGKHYEILNVHDIIRVSYSERNEISRDDYDEYIHDHNCELVGTKYGFK